MNNTESKRVLVCGAGSFVGRGLPHLLREQGHDVTEFSRGPVAVSGRCVTGPVREMTSNPHLTGLFDVVVNLILLKDETISDNEAFIEALLAFCRDRQVPHLIHFSSMSVYPSNAKPITETAPISQNPLSKGSYGSLKVATDLYLEKHSQNNPRVTYVRPGFVLGPGILSPIIGMAFRFGNNKLLQVGRGNQQLPITTRTQVQQAVGRLVARGPEKHDDVILLVDKNSPTRRQWLEACCTEAGCAEKVIAFPVTLWLLAGLGGELVARLLRMSIHPNTTISNACRPARFDSTISEQELDMSLACDWKKELRQSLDSQDLNYQLPYQQVPDDLSVNLNSVAFWGFGGIVKQKHLPGIRSLGFTGNVEAFDLTERLDQGQRIQAIRGDEQLQSDMLIVASPGPAHTAAIPVIERFSGPVLIEKPLCSNVDELQQWEKLADSRTASISICHNYRFKSNVVEMMRFLQRYHSGKLLHVHLEFQSPGVGLDSAAWRRRERKSQTLLMDYALHFVDLGCMFTTSAWRVQSVRHSINCSNETGMIDGMLTSDAYDMSFVLRQGFQPRRCRLLYNFQNYAISLGFFPDTFVAHMANDGAALYAAERKASARATRSKIKDKLLGRDSDRSHSLALYAAAKRSPLAQAISVQQMASFYRCLFEISHRVYG